MNCWAYENERKIGKLYVVQSIDYVSLCFHIIALKIPYFDPINLHSTVLLFPNRVPLTMLSQNYSAGRSELRPLAGHPPYQKNLGIIQIAGQSQSPFGNLALNSTLPQVKVKDQTVVILPLIIEGRQLTPFDYLLHPLLKGALQKSPGDPPHCSYYLLFLTYFASIFSYSKTGCIYRIELFVYVGVRLLSYILNL